jgi:hypothetical protein
MDENDHLIPLGGEATISHQEGIWFNHSRLRILLENPIEFQSDYKIVPFGPDKDFTTWTSLNPALGRLAGKFVIVDDSILSFFQSEDGQYTGFEYLRKLDESTYTNRGALFQGAQKGSSWIAELRKIR